MAARHGQPACLQRAGQSVGLIEQAAKAFDLRVAQRHELGQDGADGREIPGAVELERIVHVG